ncbi:MAG: hypothetical protein JST54_28090 [Deltaproteobacteria bacterium]|nr:hypothetical protein [Deltaproteobacteria bacterium]
MISASDVQPGMSALSSDGAELGAVCSADADGFQVARGGFFYEDYPARYADVREVRGGALVLSHDAEWFHARALLDLPSALGHPHGE